MTSQLILSSNSPSNPQTIDLTAYMDVQEGQGMDPANPAFTNRVWSRSLLKAGATLALEQLTEKELTFPLMIGPIGGVTGAPQTTSATLSFIQQINMLLETPGATLTWQPLGATQPTTFDVLSGLVEVEYSFRKEQQKWTAGNMRVFTQPLGRTSSPRVYATASGVGPLLMISPYASSGALAVGASTQAGVAGYGGQQQGANSGVFYWGAPSLAGDAPAQLQISYVGPLPNTATLAGTLPTVAVSVLPDQYYHPLVTASQMRSDGTGASMISDSTAVSGQYLLVANRPPGGFQSQTLAFSALLGASSGVAPTNLWTGHQRLLAIARASAAPGALLPLANSLVQTPTVATVNPGTDWQAYDLGTFVLRPSETPAQTISVKIANGGFFTGASNVAIEVSAFVVLPDATTWFFSANSVQPSQWGYPQSVSIAQLGEVQSAPYTNTFILDGVLGDQFNYRGATQTFAPSPLGSVPSSVRLTQYARGLQPDSDPKNGLPIIAILGVAQSAVQAVEILDPISGAGIFPLQGASWVNPQNLSTYAQVNVLERARYVLP